jgi:rhodanese-related sulfurtransferase
MTVRTAVRSGEWLHLAGACASLLALATALGLAVNFLRPAASRLPWVGDWNRHIETQAFKAGIPVVFLGGARERVGDAATIILDARVPEQYEAGHLPRARNLPVGEVDPRLVAYASLLTMQTPILVYCGGADCGDALELAVKLRALGFEDLTLYPGGYAEWIELGGAVRTGNEP